MNEETTPPPGIELTTIFIGCSILANIIFVCYFLNQYSNLIDYIDDLIKYKIHYYKNKPKFKSKKIKKNKIKKNRKKRKK